MTTTTSTPGSTDLLSATFLFSLILHGVLILGITFVIAKPKPHLPTLDVTLVNTANREMPEHADFLAQASNAGGGNSDKVHQPSQPVSGLLPTPTDGLAPRPLSPSAPSP
ncbi:MAG TPA: energy transducer TonB, partial [Rhodanobacteraceae bacterium]|nr:energy transducer TonB [Rhodanobacteraceae bacterium]